MTDIWVLEDLACHDASCAPPPVGTGGSKPGPGRGQLSPKASERKNPPKAITTNAYELRKHGLRELFDGEIGKGLRFGDDTDVQWVSDEYGWFVTGNLVNGVGDSVAFFERSVGVKGGKIVATHDTLRVNEGFQGSGYAQAFNDHLMTWYEKVGVDRIELTAGHEVGPYAWARQGYRIQGAENGPGWNRKRWVSDRLDNVEKLSEDPDLRAEVRALRNASNRGEDVQPIHVASLGQNDPDLHWNDPDFGDMWPGKRVLVEMNYQETDRRREYDGVYYLGS